MTALYMALTLAVGAADAPSVRFEPGTAERTVRVRATFPEALLKGLPAGPLTQQTGEAWLSLGLVDPETKKLGPPMLGRYERAKGEIVFTPRHALLAGQRYRATLRPGVSNPTTADHVVPAKKAAPRAHVVKVYPTAAELPANQLKFYVYFSRPMRETRTIFDQIQILDEKGDAVVDPWRRTELWSEDGKRLTLWIHPGRIKTGVNLNTDLGPVLEEGKAYSLVLPAKLLDTEGRPLEKAFTKRFRATKSVRAVVDVEKWKLSEPKAGGRVALAVTFPRPLDHALLQRFVEVYDENGLAVAGRIEVGKEERSMTFTPARAWEAKDYRLVVDARLEDLAGNSVEQVFDVDAKAPDETAPARSVKFQPKK